MQSTIVTKAEKAHRYAQEPDRLSITALEATFEAGGGTHVIGLNDGSWTCDCDFFRTQRRVPPHRGRVADAGRPPGRGGEAARGGPARGILTRGSPRDRPTGAGEADAGPPQPSARSANAAMDGTARSGRASAGGVAPLPGRPWRRSIQTVVMPSALRGHVVVEQALGHVEDPLAGHPDALERDLEVARARLVGAHLLRGDDVVERHAQARGSTPRTGRRRSW